MNKKQFISVAIISLLLVTTFGFVMAYFPDTHYFQTIKTIEDPINSELYNSCANNPDQCYAGDILADVSVIFYFTSFNKYAVTHSPAFCDQMLKEANGPIENACAVGACLHQTQDYHSHNEMVPYAITHSFLPNGVIHPPAEQHLDNIINEQNPEIHQQRLQATETFEQCTPIFKRVMSTQEEYRGVNLDAIFDKFVVELQAEETGYNPSFSNISSIPITVLLFYGGFMLLFATLSFLLVFKRLRYRDVRNLLNWISVFFFGFIFFILAFVFIANIGGQAFQAYTFIIKPISNFVPLGPHDAQPGIDFGKDFLERGVPALFDTDASGGENLGNADRSIIGLQYLFGFILIALFILLLYFNFRTPKKRRSQEF